MVGFVDVRNDAGGDISIYSFYRFTRHISRCTSSPFFARPPESSRVAQRGGQSDAAAAVAEVRYGPHRDDGPAMASRLYAE